MYTFTVNGKTITTEQDKKLLRFLRDDLALTGTKDGCSEGACGTCTVIIDGKATKACVPALSKLEGRSIVTIEGLSEREQAVYSYCFAEAGAVQCGYCTPGMIMAAKALIDVNPTPAVAEVKKAIRGNICRCTGYVKIEKAILMAAEYIGKHLQLPAQVSDGKLSHRLQRVDAREKALGTGVFVDDIRIPGMIYAKALRSAYPRAIVDSIDISKALRHPDVVRILTAADVPHNKLGHIQADWDVMIAQGDRTRYIGDALALVATHSPETLDEVLSLIKVDYTVLEPVATPQEALKTGAPKIHSKGNILTTERLKRGNAEEALAHSAHVVTQTYSTPFTEHAFMEPECAIAMPQGEDGLLLYTASQSVFDEQHGICHMLGLSPQQVHIQSKLVGGGFGGKEDMSVQHHAALMAWYTKLPVKVRFSRQESINIHPKRHAMEMEFTTACDAQGHLTAMKAVIIADTGAYASLGGPVLQRACTHAAGPYNYQNVDILGMAVYTNNVPAGAFRGFGVTQSCFAIENNINLLAAKVGLSPWEMRFRNAIRPGQVLPNGQIADSSTALEKCLLAVKTAFDSGTRTGIACAFKNSGYGVGVPDAGRCIISVEQGTVHIRTSAACMGQGLATVMTQLVCETTGIDPLNIFCERPDTMRTPDSGTSTASRQTVITGEAVRRAAGKLKLALDGVEGALDALEGAEFSDEFLAQTDPMGSTKEHPVSHIAYSYSAQVVELDEKGRLAKVTAACDIGTVVNPTAAEGQIEGGVLMGLGYALTENYPVEGGYPKAKYGTLGLFRATEVPPIEVILVQNEESGPYSYGAKGVGELCTIPTAPAVQNAYWRLDGQFRTKLPLEKTTYRP
ncbi:MAG: selenium-dependent xanthine dehydrogenase [Sphaerochaetaceae bacterium]